MEVKKNQTFFHGAYSKLASYIKSKFLSFMTKVNPNKGNETKSDIFQWDIFKSEIIFHWLQNANIF